MSEKSISESGRSAIWASLRLRAGVIGLSVGVLRISSTSSGATAAGQGLLRRMLREIDLPLKLSHSVFEDAMRVIIAL
jgi:hypothetical protein